MKKVSIIFLSVAIAFLSVVLFAEERSTLSVNRFYDEAQKYFDLAKTNYDKGEYQKSYSNTARAKELVAKAKVYNYIIYLNYKAGSWREKAESAFEYVSKFGAETNEASSNIFRTATNYYTNGLGLVSAAEKTEDVSFASNNLTKAIGAYSNAYNLLDRAFDAARMGGVLKSLIARAKKGLRALIEDSVISIGDEDDNTVSSIISDAESAYDDDAFEKGAHRAREAIDLIDVIRLRDKAEKLFALASSAFDGAGENGSDKRHPDKYKKAKNFLAKAQENLSAEEYKKSIFYSGEVMRILEGISSGAVLPKYYKVRLMPRRRDCLWRIAEYDFVYSEGKYWHVLYTANKQKLKDPDNPDLIFPGQVFVIPSIKGEKREGVYDPNKRYTKFSAEKEDERDDEVEDVDVDISPEEEVGETKGDASLPRGESAPFYDEYVKSVSNTANEMKKSLAVNEVVLSFVIDTRKWKNIVSDKTSEVMSFTPPLLIKSSWYSDPWKRYEMYDDGTHGDVLANDGIYVFSIKLPKTNEIRPFAFEDESKISAKHESLVMEIIKQGLGKIEGIQTVDGHPAMKADKSKLIFISGEDFDEAVNKGYIKVKE